MYCYKAVVLVLCLKELESLHMHQHLRKRWLKIFHCQFNQYVSLLHVFDSSLHSTLLDHSPADSIANTESEWTSDDSLSGIVPPVSSSRKPHQGEKEIR